MRNRMTVGVLGLLAAAAIAVCGPEPLTAQNKDEDKKSPPPEHKEGHDLKVRPAGKADFDKDTLRIGVEVYSHPATGAIIGISETGALAVVPAGPVGPEKTCKWLTALELSVRKAGEKYFTQKTKKYGIELFRDQAVNQLLYVCESGSIAFAPVPPTLVTDKSPNWSHGFEPRVRGYDQVTFENARKFGLEVSKNENTGGLIYITETGAIAAGPAPAQPIDPKTKDLPPKSAYGLNLRVRGALEKDFSEKTKKIGVEIFEDGYAENQLFYLSETGFISVVPNHGVQAEAKGVSWKAGLVLRARKGGEKAFAGAPQFGVEVFTDNHTGNTIFICETGSIAVLPKP